MESKTKQREHWLTVAARLEAASDLVRHAGGKRGTVAKEVRDLATEQGLSESTMWRFLSAARHLRILNERAATLSNGSLNIGAELGPQSIEYLFLLSEAMPEEELLKTMESASSGELAREGLRVLWKTYSDLRKKPVTGSFDRVRESQLLGHMFTGSHEWLGAEYSSILQSVRIQNLGRNSSVVFDAVAVTIESPLDSPRMHGIFVRHREGGANDIAIARALCHYVWVAAPSTNKASRWGVIPTWAGQLGFDAANGKLFVIRRAKQFPNPKRLAEMAVATLCVSERLTSQNKS